MVLGPQAGSVDSGAQACSPPCGAGRGTLQAPLPCVLHPAVFEHSARWTRSGGACAQHLSWGKPSPPVRPGGVHSPCKDPSVSLTEHPSVCWGQMAVGMRACALRAGCTILSEAHVLTSVTEACPSFSRTGLRCHLPCEVSSLAFSSPGASLSCELGCQDVPPLCPSPLSLTCLGFPRSAAL